MLAERLGWPAERVADMLPRLTRRRLIQAVTEHEPDPAARLYRPTVPLLSRWLLAQS
jgi:hypothetical protein